MSVVQVTEYKPGTNDVPPAPYVKFYFEKARDMHDAIYVLLTCEEHPDWHCFQVDHPYTLWTYPGSRECFEKAGLDVVDTF